VSTLTAFRKKFVTRRGRKLCTRRRLEAFVFQKDGPCSVIRGSVGTQLGGKMFKGVSGQELLSRDQGWRSGGGEPEDRRHTSRQPPSNPLGIQALASGGTISSLGLLQCPARLRKQSERTNHVAEYRREKRGQIYLRKEKVQGTSIENRVMNRKKAIGPRENPRDIPLRKGGPMSRRMLYLKWKEKKEHPSTKEGIPSSLWGREKNGKHSEGKERKARNSS